MTLSPVRGPCAGATFATMLESSDIRLRLAGAPENVTVVRELLAGVAQPLDLPERLLEDIRTVVSEACNNIVVHAYVDPPGPMQVDLRLQDGALVIVVRDEGAGIRPHAPSHDDDIGGIGLAVIQAFTDRAQLSGSPQEGTEVRMWFTLPTPPIPPPEHAPAADSEGLACGTTVPAPDAEGLTCGTTGEHGEATLSAAPGALLPGALGRVAAALGARARIPVDRLSDVQLVVDALAVNAPEVLARPRLHAVFAPGERRLQMSVGPLVPGGSQELLDACAVAELGSVLERLSEDLRIERHTGCEVMVLGLGGPS